MKVRALLVDRNDTLHDKAATTRIFATKHYLITDLASREMAIGTWTDSYLHLNDLKMEETEVFNRLGEQSQLDAALCDQLLMDFDENFGPTSVPFEGAFVFLCEARPSFISSRCIHQR